MRSAIVATLMLTGALPALASSDGAWEEFARDVEAACLAAAQPMFDTAAALVDPYGSESFGLALISGKAKGADAQISVICVYDKQTQAVEIGGELPLQ